MKKLLLVFMLFLVGSYVFADITLPEKVIVIGINSDTNLLNITAIDLSNNEIVIITYNCRAFGGVITMELVKLTRTGMTVDINLQQNIKVK